MEQYLDLQARVKELETRVEYLTSRQHVDSLSIIPRPPVRSLSPQDTEEVTVPVS